ncbi:MAG: hypothetical protein M1281_09040, partial [Chloroflexi bacterium]|nr:hypothetical protein [Chloroflexota bacterium]
MLNAAWRLALIAALILTGCSGMNRQGGGKVAAEPVAGGSPSLTNRPVDPPDYSELLRDPTEALRGPTLTPTITLTPGPTATPFRPATITPSPVPSPTPTQIPLPILTLDKFFTQGVAPATYLKDQCQYLRDRWNPENSQPGTVVVPVMYHSIVPPGRAIPASDTTTITTTSR